MDLPRPKSNGNLRGTGLAQKMIVSSSSNRKSLQMTVTNDTGKVKQHNFKSSITNAQTVKSTHVNYEPKIMRKSTGAKINKSNHNLAKPKIDQNRSTNYAPNFPDLKESRQSVAHKEDNSHSLINLHEQIEDVEHSW